MEFSMKRVSKEPYDYAWRVTENLKVSVDNSVDWNREATLRLISLFEKHNCLYDAKHKLYHNRQTRYDALTSIANGMRPLMGRVNQEDVKLKINNLRSQYNHELNKQQNRANLDEIYEPSAYWFPKLSFLKGFINPRKRKRSFEELSDSSACGSILPVNTCFTISDVDESNVTISPKYTITTIEEAETCSSSSKDIRKLSAKLEPDNPVASTIVTTHSTEQKYSNDIDAFGEFVKAEISKVSCEGLRDEVKFEITKTIFEIKSRERMANLI